MKKVDNLSQSVVLLCYLYMFFVRGFTDIVITCIQSFCLYTIKYVNLRVDHKQG